MLEVVECKWLFSATIPQDIKQIVNQHLSEEAYKKEVSGSNVVNRDIEHQYLICEEHEKLNVLLRFLSDEEESRGIVFCKTKSTARKLAKQLIAKNIAADAIHGDLKQIERDKVMRAFRNQNLQLLVATDLAARGLDIEGLNYVVHYQLPDKDEYYTHRSGRTGRAGKEGVSLCLVTTSEKQKLFHYEKILRISFTQIRQG